MSIKALNLNLFKYLDYRKFLKDYYEAAKQTRAGYSFRAFSKKAGFASPNFLKLVMEGDRNFTSESVESFCKGMGFNKQEQGFFKNLVLFNQAKTDEEKNKIYRQLMASQQYSRLKEIEKNQYEYCSHWYHAAIRELVTSENFDGTPEWLTRRLFPEVGLSQIKQSLNLLESLGFIIKVKDKYQQSHPILSTGNEVTSLALFNYHLEMLDVSKEVLQTLPASRRDMSALTLGVSRDLLPEIKKKVQEFRQEILKLASLTTATEEVIQLNMQLFPLTVNKNEGATK